MAQSCWSWHKVVDHAGARDRMCMSSHASSTSDWSFTNTPNFQCDYNTNNNVQHCKHYNVKYYRSSLRFTGFMYFLFWFPTDYFFFSPSELLKRVIASVYRANCPSSSCISNAVHSSKISWVVLYAIFSGKKLWNSHRIESPSSTNWKKKDITFFK